MMFSSFIFRRGTLMYASKLVFSQVIDHLPIHTFGRCVVRYQGNRYVKSFSCLDQYLCMAFAQLTYRESLRAIEACLRAQKDKLYHMGIRGGVSKSTLADANEARDWRIYADFAQSLIGIARPLYADEELGLDLDNTVYALDASTIDLCLSVFPWALFRNRFGSSGGGADGDDLVGVWDWVCPCTHGKMRTSFSDMVLESKGLTT
jgi:hypothetical protein